MLQLKDFFDVLNAIHNTQYLYLFCLTPLVVIIKYQKMPLMSTPCISFFVEKRSLSRKKYTWVQSKLYMHNIPWKLRKKKKKFHEYVRLSIDQDEGEKLSQKQIRKFAAQVRDYIAAYYILFSSSEKTKYLQG